MTIEIDADFPGGNIVVEHIDGDTVRLRQHPRDTDGWWFYWCFRVSGAEGRTVNFQFTDGEVIGVRGAAVLRPGMPWRWLEEGKTDQFRYTFHAGDDPVYFGMTPLYVRQNWDRFLAEWAPSTQFTLETLCHSRHGRSVPCLTLHPRKRLCHRILFTCRHHCCEAMASYVLEGVLSAIMSVQTPGVAWLADYAEVFCIPLMDTDGVEEGDQGKNRRPYDHNRDYGDAPIYAEVHALQERVSAWAEGRLSVAFDLHNPWIRGAHNESIYLVGSGNPEIWQAQQRFGIVLEQLHSGLLPYRAKENLPFGVAWNTGENLSGKMSCSKWLSSLPGMRLASSLEVPYANANGVAVTPASAALFGADLAESIAAYLHQDTNST